MGLEAKPDPPDEGAGPEEQGSYIQELERRLAEAQANLRVLAAAQIDAVLESGKTTPLLLREAQAALQRSKLELEQKVAERTEELSRANARLLVANQELEARQEALLKAKWELEVRVQERTQELSQKNAILEAEVARRQQMQRELAEVQRRLLDRAESERLKLAQELHDGPMQELYGVLYQLVNLNNETGSQEVQEDIEVCQAKLERVIQSLRLMAGELRPPVLAPYGLEKSIRSHASQFAQDYPELSIHLELMPDETSLPEHMRLALYRIYQIALTNVIRHAEARNVQVRLMIDDSSVVLWVQDDGRGFEVPENWFNFAHQGHLGLAGAAERAEAIGGQLEVQSTAGKGTVLKVRLPAVHQDEPKVG